MIWVMLFTMATLALSGVACHAIAKSRGGNPVFWGVMGLVFGPLAIPFVFLGKTKHSQ